MNEIGKLRKWASMVPESELDLPFFIIHRRGGEAAISAKQAERSLKREVSQVGNRFRIEHMNQPKYPKLDLTLLRLKRRLEMMPAEDRDKPVIANLAGDIVSRVREVAEIERNTVLGQELRAMHDRYVKWLRRRYNDA